MFNQLAKQLTQIKFASITFSFPHEYSEASKEHLEKHKSPKHKELGDKIKKLNDDIKKAPTDEEKSKLYNDLQDLHYEQYEEQQNGDYAKEKHVIDPELNMANGNAMAVLRALGYSNPDYTGDLDVQDLNKRILRLKNLKKEQERAKQHERPAKDEKKPGQARIIDHGIDLDYILQRTKQLEDMVQKAIMYGVKTIQYG